MPARSGFPGSIFAMDALGNTIEATGLGFDDGDADRSCIPVDDSLVCAPWMAEGVAQIQVSMADHDGKPFYGDPRHVLGQVVEAIHRAWVAAGSCARGGILRC